MTFEELKQLDTKKLQAELAIAKEAVFKAKFEVHSGQSKNSHTIELAVKRVAQIKTLIKQQNDQN